MFVSQIVWESHCISQSISQSQLQCSVWNVTAFCIQEGTQKISAEKAGMLCTRRTKTKKKKKRRKKLAMKTGSWQGNMVGERNKICFNS